MFYRIQVLKNIGINISYLNLRHTCSTFENNELPMTNLSMSVDRFKIPLLCMRWKYCIHHSIRFRRSWHHHASIRCNTGRIIWISVAFDTVRPWLQDNIELSKNITHSIEPLQHHWIMSVCLSSRLSFCRHLGYYLISRLSLDWFLLQLTHGGVTFGAIFKTLRMSAIIRNMPFFLF